MSRWLISFATISGFLLITSSPIATIINIPADYAAIQDGIDACVEGDTVLVQPGLYRENLHLNDLNIVLGSLFLITGDTSYIGQTIIDGCMIGTTIAIEGGQDSTTMIVGLKIQDGFNRLGSGIRCINSSPTIIYNFISDNLADHDVIHGGVGIYCLFSNSLISNNTISYNIAGLQAYSYNYGGGILCSNFFGRVENNTICNNSAGYGGGLYIANSSCTVTGNIIFENTSTHYYSTSIGGRGAGIYIDEAIITISNNLLYRNNAYSSNQPSYGAAIYMIDADINLINNTMYNNAWSDSFSAPEEIMVSHSTMRMKNNIVWSIMVDMGVTDDSSTIEIQYSDIKGGWQGDGNLDIDPRFRDPINDDYHLMAIACGNQHDSPCIDAGDPDISDTLLSCDWGLGTQRCDMGMYAGGEGWVGINTSKLDLPGNIALLQNYPNPFNASTTINYKLPQQSHVAIDIYDILGRRIITLEDGLQPAGNHRLIWQPGDIASGMYFYKLQAGYFNATKKMLLIK